jgi:hypothetical protein
LSSGVIFLILRRDIMKKFLKHYKNPNKDKFNYPLINREYDDSIVEYIVDCCKSLEVVEYIKFVGYSYETDESKIDTSEYISAKTRSVNKKSRIKRYRYLEDSRYGELKLKFHLRCAGDNNTIEECDIVKKLLVPVPDRNNLYTIKGNKYFLMYQIVDNSTYTTKKSLILKSMMPVPIQIATIDIKDTEGNQYSVPIYTLKLFKKEINILLFYLSRMSYEEVLRFFSLDKIMIISSQSIDDEDYISFQVNSKICIDINKKFFNKYQYVRTMVGMFISLMNNRTSLESIVDRDYWLTLLGSIGTSNKNNQYEKGLNTLTFVDRMLDDTTKKILKVHPIHKQDIYTILRWMIMHFEDLRKKDNLDLANRRLRCNEYIAALLTTMFTDRINRVIVAGKKATMKQVKDIFAFPGDIITTQLHISNLLRYDDRVNDMNFFGKLRATMKGPNSLGGNNDKNISDKYRSITPSYIGRIDLNVCGEICHRVLNCGDALVRF